VNFSKKVKPNLNRARADKKQRWREEMTDGTVGTPKSSASLNNKN
jgi:hypothetical protein